MPTGTGRESMSSWEDLADADDAVLVAWTLWLRAGDLRRYALLARDRAGRGIAPQRNVINAAAVEAEAGSLLRLAGIPPSA
jgi:hypothetical protein